MSYGPSMDKSKLITLVKNTGWNEFIELNRMAFDDYLPKNAESRCIAQSIRLIRKNAPHIKWVISFADATQCGDGAIYRASGFVLTGITNNKTIMRFPNGQVISNLTLRANFDNSSVRKLCHDLNIPNKYRSDKEWEEYGVRLQGYMLRYIYFIDKSCKERLTVPILPFSKINEVGARMYKGEKINNTRD